MERDIVKSILTWLNTRAHVKAIKLHGSIFTEAGTPDILVCWGGHCVFLEAKTEHGKVSKIQSYRLQQWRNAGATCLVVRSLDEVKELFASMDEENVEDLLLPG